MKHDACFTCRCCERRVIKSVTAKEHRQLSGTFICKTCINDKDKWTLKPNRK